MKKFILFVVSLLLSFSPVFAQSVDFPVNDLNQWKISGAHSDKLEISVKDGALLLHWPGGAGQAIVEHVQQASVKPLLNEGFVRYRGALNLIENTYGAEFSVQLQPVREDSKFIAPYYMRQPQRGAEGQVRSAVGSMDLLYAAPGKWANFDFNYKAPTVVTAVKPRFVLQGNAITVAIKSACVERGLTWERGRPKAQPEPRAFDAKHVAQILADREWAKPQLVKEAGRVALHVNGDDVLPAVYTRGPFYPQYTRYGEFAKAGFNIVRISASFGPLSSVHAVGVGNLWRGKSTFDFTELERELKVIANINPKALVIVSAKITPYNGWAAEHPDSIFANAKGEKLITGGGEGLQYGGEPDYSSNREQYYAPSFYGGAFPADAADAVKHLTQFLQTSPVGKIVIGVEFTGGTDGQLYPWDRDRARGADYSPVGLAGWRQYLKEKYKNDVSQLRAAWNDNNVTFENASVPTLAQRGYGKSTFVTPSGADYNLFLSQAINRFIFGLGKSVKEASNNRLLTGVYFSDSGEQGVISHGDMNAVTHSPYIDMVRSVMRYQTSGSWWRHNKLTWAELDMRPPMPNPMQYFTAGLIYPAEQFETWVWRNSVMALTDLRGGYYPYDMAESWYQTPDTINVFGKVRAGLQSAIDDSVNIPPTIGVISDESLPFKLPGTLGYELTRTSSFGLFRALDRSGVTYARYVMEDALDPTFALPKICILRLPMTVTAHQSKVLLEKARQSGSIIIWGYAPGELTSGAKSVSGFDAVASDDVKDKLIVLQNTGALTAGIENQFLGTPPPPISYNDARRWNDKPYVITPQAGDIILGKYADSDQAGAVLRSHDGLQQIIIGRPGALSPQFIRNLAKSVGVTPFNDANDEMRFGSGILAFYSEHGGARNITLPTGMKVAASPTNTPYQMTSTGFTFESKYSDIAVFKIIR